MYSLDERKERLCYWNDPEVFEVVTAQWPWEIEQAARLIGQLRPMRVMVEIGTQNGGSLRYWLKALPYNAYIYAIDPAMNINGIADERVVPILALSTDKETVKSIEATAPIDALFIDGDHSYTVARADFETYAPMVRPGGVVLMHDIDTHREDCGVPQLWREIQAAGFVTQEIMCNHSHALGGPGGGIGVVYL